MPVAKINYHTRKYTMFPHVNSSFCVRKGIKAAINIQHKKDLSEIEWWENKDIFRDHNKNKHVVDYEIVPSHPHLSLWQI